jgi:molybdopterin-containing oxidoreductase family iron-sulfur binding subunit
VKVQLSRFLTYCSQNKSSWSSGLLCYFCFDGFDFANLLVKTREGRPIKIDNNTISGAKFANARIHASILSLYDNIEEPKIVVKIQLGSCRFKKLNQVVDAKAKGTSSVVD